MKRFTTFLTVVMVLAVAASALAGGDKCEGTAQECLDYMATKYASKGWAGFEGDFNEEKGIFTVTAITAGSPAETAGFQVGDILFASNGMKFAEMTEEDHMAQSKSKVPGGAIEYGLKRDGKKMSLSVTLAEMPEDVVAKAVGKHLVKDHVSVASVQ